MTGNDLTLLRLLLNSNFNQGNLSYYESGKFRFEGIIQWPDRMRRFLLSRYSQQSITEKKDSIQKSLQPFVDLSVDQQEFYTEQITGLPVLNDLLLTMLRPSTIKRISQRLAEQSEKDEHYLAAVTQYLRAGSLQAAERTALVAASELEKSHELEAAVGLLGQVIEFASLQGKLYEVRQLILIRGDLYKTQGITELALRCYRQIIQFYDDHISDSLLGETYKNLGDIYFLRKEYDNGIAALHQALDTFESLGDELKMSHVKNNIGNMYWVISDFSKAIASYRSALAIQRRLGADKAVATTLGNIASVNCIQGRLRRAIKIFKLALKIQKEIGDSGEISRTLNNLGYAYNLSGETEVAIEHLTESLRLNRMIGKQADILHNLDNLSSMKITAGQLKTLLPYLKEGITLSTEIGDESHLAQFQLSMAIVFKRTGQFRKSFAALTQVEEILKKTDNPVLNANCAVQRGSLFHYMGDDERARLEADEALELAESSGDAACHLNALMLGVRLTGNDDLTNSALKLAGSLHLERERRLIHYIAAFHTLESGIDRVLPESVVQELKIEQENIETAWMCNVAAELLLRNKKVNEASQFVQRGMRCAKTSALMPELITCHMLAGRLSAMQGDYEEAFRSCRDGLSIARELAGEIDGPANQALFQQMRAVTLLAGEIRTLTDRLKNKKGQVN